MIPETTYNNLSSEMAAAPERQALSVGNYLELLNPNNRSSSTHIHDKFTHLTSTATTMTTSGYLQRIPSGSRQWEIYLEDLVDSKAKRSRRAKTEKENVNDFLQRFPIFER